MAPVKSRASGFGGRRDAERAAARPRAPINREILRIPPDIVFFRTMSRHRISRRSFVKATTVLPAVSPFAHVLDRAQRSQAAPPLFAYVGTFSSPLKDTLPTQVDLPPGNGRGIHIFRVDPRTGAMTPSGIVEMGTSPSCLALNAAGTRLYSANETDRVGEDKQGSASAFAVDRTDGGLKLLNTVRTGGAGPIMGSETDSVMDSVFSKTFVARTIVLFSSRRMKKT